MSSDPRRILITGCSGGGKSTLIAALTAAGLATVPEPGRRIIAAVRAGQPGALPWDDPLGFARHALEMARGDFHAAPGGPVFFDRGVIDAACAVRHLTGQPLAELVAGVRYHDPVFLAPPWREVFAPDDDRQHGFDAAVAEYARIADALTELDHGVALLPRATVAARVSFVRTRVGC